MRDWFIKNLAYFMIGFVTIIVASYIYLIANNERAMVIFGDATQLLIALFAGISIPLLFGQKEFRERIHTVPWHFIGAGFIAWALGQAYWSYQEIVRHIDMAALDYSKADLGFLLLYPLVLIAFIVQIKNLGRIKMPPFWLTLILLAFAGLMTYFSWGSFQYYWGTNNIAFILQICYLVGDVSIVIGTTLIAWNTRGGLISIAWSILMTSFVFFALGNQLYNFYEFSLGGYKTGSLIDLTWIVAFIIAWVGANVFHTMLKERI